MIKSNWPSSGRKWPPKIVVVAKKEAYALHHEATKQGRSMSARRILMQDDLAAKGIRYHRSTIYRKVQAGTFPPPDGKTTDAPSAPNFWFESTIDRHLRERARKTKQARQKDQVGLPPPDTS